MNINVITQETLQLSDFESDELNVELKSEALYFGAISMFVASLGRCTYAVLNSYAMRLDLPLDNITMQLTWEYSQQPTRISKINMQIRWPELPEKRLKSVERAAHLCTIHQTIHNCVDIHTQLATS
ncbi:MAG TPA: OsmC family peroxiredoxin [Chromatiales bacterium]|nr:OsmC family peroxiredoxin [Thiotrichales bacterium]HIP67526.1 OsmC family peroxiredoxin [Chromatiales bacterium]